MRPEIREQVDWTRVIAAFNKAPFAVKLGRVRQKPHGNASKIFFGKEPVIVKADNSRVIYINLLEGDQCKITIYQPPGLFFVKTVLMDENFNTEYYTKFSSLNNNPHELSSDQQIIFCESNGKDSHFDLENYLYNLVIGVSKYSILRMSDDVYAVKGIKEDRVGEGSFATIKDTLLYQPHQKFPCVIRSYFVSVDKESAETQKIIFAHQLDGALARQVRVLTRPKKRGKAARHYALLEKAESDLEDYLKKNKASLSEEDRWEIAFSLLREVVNLHKKDIAHRDLKLKNVLFFANNRIKLCDFDLLSEKILEKCGLDRGSLLTLPNFFGAQYFSAQALDEYAVRRMCLLTSPVFYASERKCDPWDGTISYQWKPYRDEENNYVSIFDEEYIKTRNFSFYVMLSNNNGRVSKRSVAKLLAIFVLEWNRLLTTTFNNRRLPVRLINILEKYQEKNPLPNLSDDAKTLIRFIFYEKNRLILYEHLKKELGFAVDETVFETDSEVSTPLSANRHSLSANLARRNSSESSLDESADAWEPFDRLMASA